jgi:TolA-binding protein
MLPAQDPSNSEMRSGEIRTLPSADSDRIRLSTSRNIPPSSSKSPAPDDSCLLPPLNLATAPAVSAEQLQVPATARKEYQQACAGLKNKKAADAEKHLRKAVQAYPKYAAAWVTLGQVLAAQQRPDEARTACSHGQAILGRVGKGDGSLRRESSCQPREPRQSRAGRGIALSPGGPCEQSQVK